MLFLSVELSTENVLSKFDFDYFSSKNEGKKFEWAKNLKVNLKMKRGKGFYGVNNHSIFK